MATQSDATNKTAINAIAKAAGLKAGELTTQVQGWFPDWGVKSHQTRLGDEQVAAVQAKISGDAPAAKKPAAKKTATKTAAKKPTAKKPAAKKPAAKKAASSDDKADAVAAKPAAKKPAAKKAAAKKPAAKKPAAKKPAAKKAAAASATADEATGVAEAKKPAPRKSRAKKTDAAATADAKPAADGKPARKPRRSAKAKADGDAVASDDAKTAPKAAAPKAPPVPKGPPIDGGKEGKAYLRKLLDRMGITGVRVQTEENERRVEINLLGANASELLGRTNAAANAKLIEALQLLAGKAVYGPGSPDKAIVIDVRGFRQGRADKLTAAAERLAAFVKNSGKAVRFAAINAFDRRAFHHVMRDAGARTESEGDGSSRRLKAWHQNS